MATYDLIIKNGTVVTSEQTLAAYVAVKDGKIAKFAPNLDDSADRVIDAKGKHVFPGMVDAHVHFNEPGRTEWEGLETGSKSLAKGGATAFFDMPLNSTPPVIDKKNLDIKKDLAKDKSVVNAYCWGGLVPENIDNSQELHENAAIGFKAFMSPSGIDDFHNADDKTLSNGMETIASLGSVVAVHAESKVICEELGKEKLEAGKTSAYDFVESRPIISEIEAVRRVLSFAEATGCKLHIVHASSRKVIEVIQEAKDRGVDITVETCPHYLALTVDDLAEQVVGAKCMPPLRSQDELENLWEALKAGEIDTVGSDHSPAPASMKTITDNFFEGWGGISGAQSTLNILLTEGHFKRNVPLEKIVQVAATNPAKIFKIENKGDIKEGYDADITIVDLDESFVLEKDDLLYRHQHSPYVGNEYKGNVKTTIVNGNVVYENGEIVAGK